MKAQQSREGRCIGFRPLKPGLDAEKTKIEETATNGTKDQQDGNGPPADFCEFGELGASPAHQRCAQTDGGQKCTVAVALS